MNKKRFVTALISAVAFAGIGASTAAIAQTGLSANDNTYAVCIQDNGVVKTVESSFTIDDYTVVDNQIVTRITFDSDKINNLKPTLEGFTYTKMTNAEEFTKAVIAADADETDLFYLVTVLNGRTIVDIQAPSVDQLNDVVRGVTDDADTTTDDDSTEESTTNDSEDKRDKILELEEGLNDLTNLFDSLSSVFTQIDGLTNDTGANQVDTVVTDANLAQDEVEIVDTTDTSEAPDSPTTSEEVPADDTTVDETTTDEPTTEVTETESATASTTTSAPAEDDNNDESVAKSLTVTGDFAQGNVDNDVTLTVERIVLTEDGKADVKAVAKSAVHVEGEPDCVPVESDKKTTDENKVTDDKKTTERPDVTSVPAGTIYL